MDNNMDNNIELKSIAELLKYKVKFYIPSYQRGYRWKEKQVQQLLEDIDTFVPTEKNPFYFLQALAVAKNENEFNVVDGQQRLTTISLILNNNENREWISYDRLADNSIDGHYKDQAKKSIDSFLGIADGENKRRQIFCDKIKDKCKFLWYEVAPEKELSTFNDLNSGKIPAKDSELVKCILLSKGSDEPFAVTRARAMEWDAIEREMNNDDFFAWMTPRNAWKEDDRMTVLFRYSGFCPDEKTEEVFPFLTEIQSTIQEGKSRETIWKKICSAYYRLIAWYNDSLMYHAFGAYVHRKGKREVEEINIGTIVEIIKKVSEYKSSDDDYNNGGDNLHQYLLLANTASCWKNGTLRYSFSHHRNVGKWSLEHIFAKNQGEISEDILKTWIPGISEERIKSFKETTNKDEWLASQKELKDKYPKEDEKFDNSLGNMALLPFDVNAVLNNNLFVDKRNIIVGWANNNWKDGEFDRWVPPMTESVFMKSIPGTTIAIQFWSNNEKEVYAKYMSGLVNDFVSQLKKENGYE